MEMAMPSFVSDKLSRIPLVAPGQVRLGLVGTVRKVFEVDKGIEQFLKLVELLRKDPRISLVTADELTEKGIIWAGQLNVAQRVSQRFIGKGVDAVLIVPVNYGDEEGAATVAKQVFQARRCPVYTFVHPEVPIKEDGTRSLDDGCGIWPMRQHMRRTLKRTPGYIPSFNPGSTHFNKGLTAMLKVAAGLRALRSVRGVQIGAAQQTFPAIEGDRQTLRDFFDLRVETTDAGAWRANIKRRMTDSPSWLPDVTNWISQWIDPSAIAQDHPYVLKLTALALGSVLEILAEKESNAVSINCWPEVQAELGLMVCAVNGLLYSLGIMAPCETDWPGCLASAFLQGFSIGDKGVGFFADLTRFEKDDRRIMWWHCGPFAPQFCRNGKCKQRTGWIFPGIKTAGLLDGPWGKLGQKVLFAQLRPDENDQLTLVGTNGFVVEGPATRGTHFYTTVKEPDIFERFMAESPFDHHNSGWLITDFVPGLSAADDLRLFCDVAYWVNPCLPVEIFDNS